MPNRISKNKKQSVVKAREDDFVQAGARSHTERIALDIVSWVLADGKFASSSRTLAHFGLPEWVDGGRIREVVAAAFGPDGRGREWAIEQIASILRSVYRRQKADRR